MVATPGPASGTAPNSAVTAAGADRFCGRLLGTQAGTASMTICCKLGFSIYMITCTYM